MANDNFKQQHFVLYELVLPYCSVCTPAGGLAEPWHTPVTCEESSDSEYSLWFTSNTAPIMSPPSQSIGIKSKLNSSVWRVVASGSETTPRLKPGDGMASRGTMSVALTDFEGDPGPITFSDNGTFFGKLKARNVLDGKKIISHRYAITSDQSAPELIGTSIHYIENVNLTGGKFTIQAKDALKDLEAFSQKFPIPSEINLTADINSTTKTIPVDDVSGFVVGGVIIIDKELMLINAVNATSLSVANRGTEYVGVYKTSVSDHKSGATVQACYVMDRRFLSGVLKDVFDTVGLGAYVNEFQWVDEIQQWNSNAYLYGVFHEPRDADDIINQLLTNYMIDMWLDQSTQKALISATTAWKESQRVIVEGDDLTNLRIQTRANTRFSRAFIYNDKDYQAENDDKTNYSRLTLHKDIETETSDLYGSVKTKEFKPSFIERDSATILVSRYVQRFARNPSLLTFDMEERKIANSRLGDVVDVVMRDSQSPSGDYLQASVRAQLIEVKPNLNAIGRFYNVTALSYVPLIAGDDLVIFITGSVFDLNLYARAGAPPEAINITFVFDGATVGSTAFNIPAITAGNFAPNSALKLIFTNGSQVSALGGKGGDAYVDNRGSVGVDATTTSGVNGANVYQSDGVETEIYINYGTVDGYVTDCDFFAAGGGGGSASGVTVGQATPTGTLVDDSYAGSALAGGGGSGIPGGSSGVASMSASSSPLNTAILNAFNGTFTTAGSGVSALANDVGVYLSEVNSTADSAAGGVSVDGGVGLYTSELVSGSGVYHIESIGTAGLAGGAIKGANVTVYSNDPSRFKAGNSDAFTLISDVSGVSGAQVGQAIITGESVWHDVNGTPLFDLLPVNTSFSASSYPLLAVIYPSLTTPSLTQEVGSPFPYKIVADYTGA